MDFSSFSYDALLFDCDGTLVNTAPVHFEAFRLALSAQGAKLDREWYDQRLGLSRADLLTAFSTEGGTGIDISAASLSSERNFLMLIDQVESIAEVVEIVHAHRVAFPMAVVSSGQRLSVMASLNAVDLVENFDAIVAAEDVEKHKPAPDPYITAAKRLGVLPERCLVFEDTDEGLKSASSAGAQVFDVRTFASIYKQL